MLLSEHWLLLGANFYLFFRNVCYIQKITVKCSQCMSKQVNKLNQHLMHAHEQCVLLCLSWKMAGSTKISMQIVIRSQSSKFLERAWCFCEARWGWAHGPRWADKCSLVAPPKNVPQSHSDRPAVRWSRCWRDWFWLRLDCDGDNIAWVARAIVVELRVTEVLVSSNWDQNGLDVPDCKSARFPICALDLFSIKNLRMG